jgi:small-conductance mechanosensitive channel
VLGELLLDWSGRVVGALAIFVIEIAVAELGPNGVSIAVRAWVGTGDQNARGDVLERIKATFAERGLKIPYPRMRLEQRPQGAE